MQFDVLVKFLSLLLLIAIQSLAQSQGKDEEWTDISGKKTVIAEFIRLEGVQLILRKADGKELVIPLNKLDDKSRIKARAIANSSMKKGEAKFPREAANSVAFRQQPKEVTNSIGMKLVLIPAGTFTMGSPLDEVGRRGDETPHEVTISNSYYLGVYEVTQDQFEKVMGKNPSNFKEARNPVENVSWDDAVAYCKKLSELPEEKAAGREYRLPTEAEWEYACRAGSSSVYFFGDSADSLPEYAWFGEGREGNSHPVGEKKPNRWGLYDMHGNVWEWCQDSHRDYQSSAVTDPRGSGNDLFRVTRGGSWPLAAFYCRSANRDWLHASKQLAVNGFRVALSTSVKSPKAEQIKGPLDAGKKGVPTEQRSVVPPAFSQQPKEITNSIGMKLVLIPAGTFTLGSPLNEVLRRGDETPHGNGSRKKRQSGSRKVGQLIGG